MPVHHEYKQGNKSLFINTIGTEIVFTENKYWKKELAKLPRNKQ